MTTTTRSSSERAIVDELARHLYESRGNESSRRLHAAIAKKFGLPARFEDQEKRCKAFYRRMARAALDWMTKGVGDAVDEGT